MSTGGHFRPLLVAGVAGGVGTSTWVRCMRLATSLPVEDLGRYGGGLVDVLVTSNTAASTSNLGPALALCPRPPVLVVMHTATGVVGESRSHLRKIDPHITARFDIAHHRQWLEMTSAPGRRFPAKATDIKDALRQFPAALQSMYATPTLESQSTRTALAGVHRTDPAHHEWPPLGGQPRSIRRGG